MRNLILAILMVCGSFISYSQNNTCATAQDLCATNTITAVPTVNFSYNVPNNPALRQCSQLSLRPTLFYRALITTTGTFTFMISSVPQNDYDWAVWVNPVCANIQTTPAARLSFDLAPVATGMNGTGTLTCDGNGTFNPTPAILAPLNVVAGDEVVIAVNYFTNGAPPAFTMNVCGPNGGGGTAQFTCPEECSDECFWKLTGNNISGNRNVFGTLTNHPIRVQTQSVERMRITETGNVGIGTTTPNAQGGWQRVLDVSGLNHAKSTVSNIASTLRAGILVHDNSNGWLGGIGNSPFGMMGTETNHPLFITTNLSAMGIPTISLPVNGHVGIGTKNPNTFRGWGRVLDVYHSEHSKILSTSGEVTDNNALVRNGIYSHTALGGWNGLSGGYGLLGTESDHPIAFLTNDMPRMFVLTNGNVGIGTSNPLHKLQIDENNGQSSFPTGAQVIRSGNSNNVDFSMTGVDYPRPMGLGVITGAGHPMDIQVTQPGWHRGFGGYTGAWYSVGGGTEGETNITGVVSQLIGTGSGNAFGFYSNLSGLSGTGYSKYGFYSTGEDKNYFSGRVGIGTTNPQSKLSINGGPLWTSNGWSSSVDISSGGALAWDAANTSDFKIGIGKSSSGTGLYFFRTMDNFGNQSTSADYLMKLDYTTGNLGIGTTNPQNKLEITHGTTGNSGLRFTNLTSSFNPNGTTSKVLTVDNTGNVVLSNVPLSNLTNSCARINMIPKLSATNTYSCSQIFDDGISVGVGATSGFTYTSLSGTTLGAILPPSSGTIRLHVNGVLRSTASIVTSDGTYKTDVKDVENGLETLKKLMPRTYSWNKEAQKEFNIDALRHPGFIAQELKKVLPEIVIEDENGKLGVNYSELIPITVQAIKELNNKVDKQNNAVVDNESLKLDIASLKAENEMMKEKFALLEKSIAVLCESGCAGLEKLGSSYSSDVDVLFQSIPNPTDSEALINYYLSNENSMSEISLYTVEGKILKTVTLEPKKGNSSIKLSLEELSNGTYLYSLYVNSRKIDTKKLQILKLK